MDRRSHDQRFLRYFSKEDYKDLNLRRTKSFHEWFRVREKNQTINRLTKSLIKSLMKSLIRLKRRESKELDN